MRKLCFILTAAALLCAPATKASIVTFDSVTPLNDGAFFIGPYSIGIDGLHYDAVCYDSAHEADPGQRWMANVFSMGQLGAAYYSEQPDYVNKYRTVAWLAGQLLNTTADQTRIDLQHAIWSVFNPRPPEPPADNWTAQAVAAAQDPGLDVSSYRVVNAAAGEPQRQGFIIDSAGYEPPDTPEPGTWITMALGLTTLAYWKGRRNWFI